MSPVWPQQPGSQHRTDPEDRGQGGAVLANRGADSLTGRLDLPVEAAHVGQQLTSDPLALDVDGGDRMDPTRQGGSPAGRELPVGAAGLQVGQQHVQPAQRPGALGDQVVAAVRE